MNSANVPPPQVDPKTVTTEQDRSTGSSHRVLAAVRKLGASPVRTAS